MKQYDILTIGNISKDVNTDCRGNTVRAVGGAVYYSSAASAVAGARVGAVTKLSPADRDLIDRLLLPKEDIFLSLCENTTSISNVYFTEDKERRSCSLKACADGYKISDIPDVECKIYHLAGLVVGDYDGELIKELSSKGKLALDVQAMLRRADGGNGEMYFADWAEKTELLPYITYLKTDAAEAEILTGLTDRRESARALFDMGAKEVIITHNTEVIVYDGRNLCSCPIKSRNLSGRTGRGDTTFGSYLAERLVEDAADALLYATAAVSLKMEKSGALDCRRSDVENYIDEFYL